MFVHPRLGINGIALLIFTTTITTITSTTIITTTTTTTITYLSCLGTTLPVLSMLALLGRQSSLEVWEVRYFPQISQRNKVAAVNQISFSGFGSSSVRRLTILV